MENQRIYTLKYRVDYGRFGDEPQEIIRKVSFSATEAEIDFLFNQIQEWDFSLNLNKPSSIFFKLGEHTLEVTKYGRFSSERFCFKFEETEPSSENWYINGFIFAGFNLLRLFGK